jgi:hypothetical protein
MPHSSPATLIFHYVWKPACSAIMPPLRALARANQREFMSATGPSRSRAVNVLTDIHFWVPALVLLGGLLLLRFLH